MIASTRTLADLGFSEVTRALGARCRSEVGRSRATALEFLETADEVKQSLRKIEEAQALAEGSPMPLEALPDLRPGVQRAEHQHLKPAGRGTESREHS